MNLQGSIIIPVQVVSKEFYIFLRHLDFSLVAINKQTVPCETILVDYMSTPKYSEKLKKICKGYDCIYLYAERKDTNTFSRGRAINSGIERANADILFFVDSDCILPPNYIEEHCKIVNEKTATFSPFIDSTSKIKKSGNWRHLRNQKNALTGLRPGSYSHVGIHRSWINKYGGFNEEYVGWGGEDDDLILRLKRSRTRVAIVNTYPIHLWHPTWQQLMKKAGKDKIQRETLRANRARYYRTKGQKVKKIKTER
jgi:predicted glycosyltransferase involved in capsule biosynthesis